MTLPDYVSLIVSVAECACEKTKREAVSGFSGMQPKSFVSNFWAALHYHETAPFLCNKSRVWYFPQLRVIFEV